MALECELLLPLLRLVRHGLGKARCHRGKYKVDSSWVSIPHFLEG